MEKYFHFDRNKTLQELEGQIWGEPNFSSHLVTTCYELRKKPIVDFTVEDLRIMMNKDFWISNNTYKNELELIIEKNIKELQRKLKQFQQENV